LWASLRDDEVLRVVELWICFVRSGKTCPVTTHSPSLHHAVSFRMDDREGLLEHDATGI
jgi:hypothetical protein